MHKRLPFASASEIRVCTQVVELVRKDARLMAQSHEAVMYQSMVNAKLEKEQRVTEDEFATLENKHTKIEWPVPMSRKKMKS